MEGSQILRVYDVKKKQQHRTFQKPALKQLGCNPQNLHVINANKQNSENVNVKKTSVIQVFEHKRNNLVPVQISNEENSVLPTESCKTDVKWDKDFDDVSDSPLDDTYVVESLDEVSDEPLDMSDAENEYSMFNIMQEIAGKNEFSVSFHISKVKYLQYKPLHFFKPKLYIISEEKRSVNCVGANYEEKLENIESDNLQSNGVKKDISAIKDRTHVLNSEEKDTCNFESDGSVNHMQNNPCKKTMPEEVATNNVNQSKNEDFFQGKAVIQSDINTSEKPLIGLEYVVEIWQKSGFDLWKYSCILCDKNYLNKSDVITHVAGITHQTCYIVKHFPSYRTVFSETAVSLNKSMRIQLRKLCKEIDEFGRQLVFITTKANFDEKKSKLIEVVNSSFHVQEENIIKRGLPEDSQKEGNILITEAKDAKVDLETSNTQNKQEISSKNEEENVVKDDTGNDVIIVYESVSNKNEVEKMPEKKSVPKVHADRCYRSKKPHCEPGETYLKKETCDVVQKQEEIKKLHNVDTMRKVASPIEKENKNEIQHSLEKTKAENAIRNTVMKKHRLMKHTCCHTRKYSKSKLESKELHNIAHKKDKKQRKSGLSSANPDVCKSNYGYQNSLQNIFWGDCMNSDIRNVSSGTLDSVSSVKAAYSGTFSEKDVLSAYVNKDNRRQTLNADALQKGVVKTSASSVPFNLMSSKAQMIEVRSQQYNRTWDEARKNFEASSFSSVDGQHNKGLVQKETWFTSEEYKNTLNMNLLEQFNFLDQKKFVDPHKQTSLSPYRKSSGSPHRKISRSPPRKASRSPLRKTSRSPHRKASWSPPKRTSRSPRRRTSRSPRRRISRSPRRRSSRSPRRRTSRSPRRRRSRSPYRRTSRSPYRRTSRSPHSTSRSPHRRTSRSPRKRYSSPHRRNSRSPHRRNSKSPRRRVSKSPYRRTSKSPHKRLHRSPGRRITRSPLRKNSRSPHRRLSRSSSRKHSKSPSMSETRSPSRRIQKSSDSKYTTGSYQEKSDYNFKQSAASPMRERVWNYPQQCEISNFKDPTGNFPSLTEHSEKLKSLMYEAKNVHTSQGPEYLKSFQKRSDEFQPTADDTSDADKILLSFLEMKTSGAVYEKQNVLNAFRKASTDIRLAPSTDIRLAPSADIRRAPTTDIRLAPSYPSINHSSNNNQVAFLQQPGSYASNMQPKLGETPMPVTCSSLVPEKSNIHPEYPHPSKNFSPFTVQTSSGNLQKLSQQTAKESDKNVFKNMCETVNKLFGGKDATKPSSSSIISSFAGSGIFSADYKKSEEKRGQMPPSLSHDVYPNTNYLKGRACDGKTYDLLYPSRDKISSEQGAVRCDTSHGSSYPQAFSAKYSSTAQLHNISMNEKVVYPGCIPFHDQPSSNQKNVFPVSKQQPQSSSFAVPAPPAGQQAYVEYGAGKSYRDFNKNSNENYNLKFSKTDSSENIKTVTVAQRLASVLVKLGMVDVPGQVLSEMLAKIGVFSQRVSRDLSESEIITVLKSCGYVS